MATLETQYKNYMDKNPLSEFTFDEWKKWWGNQMSTAFKEMEMRNVKQNITDKINNQSEFDLNKEEILFIIENWLTTHAQHKMNYVNLSCDVYANVSINKDSIFRN